MLSQDKKQRVIAYVSDNLHKNIKINDMAKVAAMSRFHFARLFRETFGMTPMQYVAAQRVKRVQELLSDNKVSLSDAAAMTGFSSQSHLTHSFKIMTGLTPGVYRRMKK